MSCYEKDILEIANKINELDLNVDKNEFGKFSYEGVLELQKYEENIKDFMVKLTNGDVNVYNLIEDIDWSYMQVSEFLNDSIEEGEDFKDYVSNYISKVEMSDEFCANIIDDIEKLYNNNVSSAINICIEQIEGFEDFLYNIDIKKGVYHMNEQKMPTRFKP